MMVVSGKKSRKRELKREQILNAAAHLFSHKNYHEVMMEDVAKMISIAKGTVYNYFNSKEELYFSIISGQLEKLIASLEDKITKEYSSIDSLHSFVIHLYMFMMKYQDFFLMYQKELMKSDNNFCKDLRKQNEQLKEIIETVITKGKQENIFRNINDEFAAQIVIGAVYGAVQRGIDYQYSSEKMIEEREKTFEFLLHGLYSGFENKKVLPLKDKTIVLTRTVEQSKESASEFSQLGANVLIFPTLEIVPPQSWKQFDEVVRESSKIDFIIFSSAHAVKMFIKRVEELGIKINFRKIKVVAIGNKTQAICREYNVPVNIVPQKFSGEAVVMALSKFDLTSKTVFIPRSAIGREEMPKGLEELGAVIKISPVYNVSLPTKETIKKNLDQLNKSQPDLFIFTSPSTFENFLRIKNIVNPVNYFKDFDVAAIGPTTKAAIEKRKVNVDIIPKEYTIKGLVNRIIEHYKNNTD